MLYYVLYYTKYHRNTVRNYKHSAMKGNLYTVENKGSKRTMHRFVTGKPVLASVLLSLLGTALIPIGTRLDFRPDRFVRLHRYIFTAL